MLLRHTLLETGDGISTKQAGRPRFQVTPDGRLFIFCYFAGNDKNGRWTCEDRLAELRADGMAATWMTIPLKHPLGDYVTATVRAGSSPSILLDLLGARVDATQTISYARIRLW